MSKAQYIPGVCNIGPAEIRVRRASGYFGLAITIALFIVFYITPVDQLWRLAVFIPATVSASGFLQAWLHFCAQFGMRGLFNVGDDLARHESVDQAAYRRKDQQKAILIGAGSVGIGLLVTLLALFLPYRI